MDPFVLGAGSVFLALLVGAAVLSYTRKTARVRRVLRSQPRVDIAAAREGPVKIAGKLRLWGKPMLAPLSRRPCALYDAQVHERSNRTDVLVIHDRLAVDFFVEDATGKALVRAAPGKQLELVIVQDARYRSGLLREPHPDLERFLTAHGQASKGVLFPRNLSYREGVFEPGEDIVVYGRGRLEPDPDAAAPGDAYRERPMRLVVEPLDGKLHVSDEPGLARDR